MFVEKEFKGLRKRIHEMWISALPKQMCQAKMFANISIQEPEMQSNFSVQSQLKVFISFSNNNQLLNLNNN